MEDFDWTSFTIKTAVKAELATIYNAWTQPGEIEIWFLKTADFYDGEDRFGDKHHNVKEGDSYN